MATKGMMTAVMAAVTLLAGCHRGHEGSQKGESHRPSHQVPDPDLIFPPGMRHVDRNDVRQMAPYAEAMQARDVAAAKAGGATDAQVQVGRRVDEVLARVPRERRESIYLLIQCELRTPAANADEATARIDAAAHETDPSAALKTCRSRTAS